ncbi:hypothetical protein ONZ45_g11569 [Pleurotus djamor]|nr:hypothetical protein ONZ45_g11569 [Pleurotus djamor]
MPNLCADVYNIIFKHVDMVTLCRLSCVSQAFRQIAESVLLQNLNLSIHYAQGHHSYYDYGFHDEDAEERTSRLPSFREWILNPTLNRQSRVTTFAVNFDGCDPLPCEPVILDEVIPTLSNLRTLHVYFRDALWLSGAMEDPGHPQLDFLKYPTPSSHLTRIQFRLPWFPDTFWPFILSQPRLKHLEILNSYETPVVPECCTTIATLQAYKYMNQATSFGFLVANPQITHLCVDTWTHPIPAMCNLTTVALACQPLGNATWQKDFFSSATSLKYIEVIGYINWDDLDPLRYSSAIHIRVLTLFPWSKQQGFQVFRSFICPPTLKCIEAHLSQKVKRWGKIPSHQATSCRSTRWYQGSTEPVEVEWTCPVDDIWCSDWERDAVVVR